MHHPVDISPPASVTPAQLDAFEQRVVAHAEFLKKAGQDRKLEAFMNGLALDGTGRRPALLMALAPYMTLPKPEPRTVTRARMAKVIAEMMTLHDHCTEDHLRQAGFTDDQISSLKHEAIRAARVARMAA